MSIFFNNDAMNPAQRASSHKGYPLCERDDNEAWKQCFNIFSIILLTVFRAMSGGMRIFAPQSGEIGNAPYGDREAHGDNRKARCGQGCA